MSKMARILQDCRRKYGMTQGQVARLAGISIRTYARWESGYAMPQICQFYGCIVCLMAHSSTQDTAFPLTEDEWNEIEENAPEINELDYE